MVVQIENCCVEPRALSTGALMPVALVLGLHREVGLSLASLITGLAPRQVPLQVWEWLRRVLKRTSAEP